MLHGIALARDLGLLEGWTAYFFGNMEEWCDGIAPRSFVEHDPKIKPDAVIIGEPTRMQIYRGHKGRVEMCVTASGRSAHAASNWLGDNALYKLLDVAAGIRDLDAGLRSDPFLGKGTITVSDLHVSTASLNAVPDQATLFIDRRVTFGDTLESALAEVQTVIDRSSQRADLTLSLLRYDEPSYTGFTLALDKYFPAWALDETHPLVLAGLDAAEIALNTRPETGKWDFSTNGTYWAGVAGIPSIGFGPGDERHAHTVIDQVPLDDVVASAHFYALISSQISKHM
jgi:putative selenium metabolism hydrolase